ncbi:MAG: hypothetical protein ACFE7E_06095 [Candidatus Hodarchaeota archaeon]
MTQECWKCNGMEFRSAIDSWMRRSIRWTENGMVKQCISCGATHYVCPQCRDFLTIVDITNVRIMKAQCPNCGHTDDEVAKWLTEMREY